ncbi:MULTISPECIES: hypothetical protein [unclassified Lonepinella]|uniref:hypothetical protein n=1 Tax=unclassified Lonepinella TaxID=2642006 RepID=UPI0036D85056
MKKFIFGLAIICCVVACSSQSVQPKDPNELPNGIMQPVAGTGAVEGGGFIPEIQPSQMPSNMK